MPSTTMPSTTRRITTTAVGIALVLTACSGDNDDTATTVPIPTTTATTTTIDTTTTTPQPATTTSSTTTSTTQPETTSTTAPTSTTTTSTTATVPTTQPGEPDWAAIVQGLLTTLQELRAEPDIDRIGEVCFPGESACARIQGEEIRRLVDEGWHVEGMPLPVVLGATLTHSENDAPFDEALWIVVRAEIEEADLSNAVIVDASGNVVQKLSEDGPGGPFFANFQLSRIAGGEWRAHGFAEASDS